MGDGVCGACPVGVAPPQDRQRETTMNAKWLKQYLKKGSIEWKVATRWSMHVGRARRVFIRQKNAGNLVERAIQLHVSEIVGHLKNGSISVYRKSLVDGISSTGIFRRGDSVERTRGFLTAAWDDFTKKERVLVAEVILT